MTIRIVQLQVELELVPNLDSAHIRILKTPGQSLRQLQMSRERIAICLFIQQLPVSLLIQLIIINCDRLHALVIVVHARRGFRIDCEFVRLHQMRRNLPNFEAFEQR